MRNEYNGIKFGDRCWAWDLDESAGKEFTFTAYLEGTGHSVKGFNDDGHVGEFRHARPLKTEAEKVLEAFEWKKIWSENRRGSCKYYIPKSIVDDGRLECIRSDGLAVCFSVEDFGDWQLWEEPKVTLDTRRVAGWWAIHPTLTRFMKIVQPNITGGEMLIGTHNLESHNTSPWKFSKDHMAPIAQWKTLEEICSEPQA